MAYFAIRKGIKNFPQKEPARKNKVIFFFYGT
jgi:hypothetical protein